ncbi:MAG: PspA/IM30 family protein [Acidimicrobiales bacterium]
MTSVDESVAGISTSIGDSGQALQRAQEKIASLQARSGALDELLESGVLEDVGNGGDDIQRELDSLSAGSKVDQELEALKAQVGPAGSLSAPSVPPPAELGAGESAEGGGQEAK